MRATLTLLTALAFAAPAFAQQQAPVPNCEAEAYRAFDFWVGEWDAFRADTNAPAGRSSIRTEDAGCVVTEHWTSLNTPYSGRSLNIYDRTSGKWEQFWVDSTGNRVHFIGDATDTGMRIATAAPVWVSPTQQAYSRITFTSNPDGTVLQHGEQSADGEAWTTSYAFIYRRRTE
jgi:hypothetical protein